ncbi:YbaB/EbfC family nucleoid-associated protein [bacterium]|nr:YbaB/EbfC family nucleoid-associated protein [bacterium]
MKGMMGGMAGLMKQANQMQMKMKKLQEELATREFSGTSGGGAVTAKVNGENKVLSLTINPEVIKAGDAEMLTDMVISAVNDALKTAKDTSSAEMSKITGGMNLPGF